MLSGSAARHENRNTRFATRVFIDFTEAGSTECKCVRVQLVSMGVCLLSSRV